MARFPRRDRAMAVFMAAAWLLVSGSSAHVQSQARTFKIAHYNIKSGFGRVGLSGSPTLFAATSNCTDRTKPLNAWGVGVVQQELVDKVGNDPDVVLLGLSEAWTCATPAAVQGVLGWAARSPEKNGVAAVARHGFAGAPQWLQLDTTKNVNPADTKWVLRVPVCLDAACTSSALVFVAHWYAVTEIQADSYTVFETQGRQTREFMARDGDTPRVLVGDLNAFESTTSVCNQKPVHAPIRALREAGYLDAWRLVHATGEGFTGMWNRNGCGAPNGYLWKRIDYAWSYLRDPLSVVRFGMVAPGHAAPSDHAGIIAEYPAPDALAGSAPPTVEMTSPADGGPFAETITVEGRVSGAQETLRVELLVNGVTQAVDTSPPHAFAWSSRQVANGNHVLQVAATDSVGHRTMSPPRPIEVRNPIHPGDEIVLHGTEASVSGSAWSMVSDATAASRVRLQNVNAGTAAPSSPASTPASHVEFTFTANAGTPYRLWLRGRALDDAPANDSVFVQFSGSVSETGASVYRIGTSSGSRVQLEECGGCGLAGWGWRDNGDIKETIGPAIYFKNSGPQVLRIQAREDGLGIDQVVLSVVRYRWTEPGAPRNDTVILPSTALGAAESAAPNAAPSVTLTNPSAGSVFSAPATVVLEAAAADGDGTVARVDFYAGTTRVGTTATSPFSFTWTDVPAGTYALTARATDEKDASAMSEPVSIEVQAPSNAPPSVALMSPVTGTIYTAPATVLLAASASDADGVIARVEFYAGASLIGMAPSSPFTATWSDVPADTYTLTARAVDEAGASATSQPVTIEVQAPPNVPPAVTLTSPADGDTFEAPAAVTLTASAADSDGVIARVEFYAGSEWLATAAERPFTTTWTDVPAGRYTLTARAYDDGGAATTSDPIGIEVRTSTEPSPTVTSPPDGGALPAGWNNGDVGDTGAMGSAAHDAPTGRFTIDGAGADIWGTTDAFHLASRSEPRGVEDGFEFTAQVTSVQNVHQWTKAGLMVRAHHGAGAPHASLFVTPTTSKGLAFQRRRAEGATSLHTAGPAITAPVWLKLVVMSAHVRAYYRGRSTDRWQFLTEDHLTYSGTTYEVGFAVSSRIRGTLARAIFDQVSVRPLESFREADIGAVGVAGSGSGDHVTRTLRGSGADIWNTADAFRYRLFDMSGDGLVSARVLSLDRTHPWAKAGVMIRESLAPGSRHVTLIVSPSRGLAMQYRAATNGVSATAALVSGAAPAWVRLVRSGSRIIGQVSDDGAVWREVGRVDLAMDAFVTAGLAVASHDNTRVASAVFDDVIVER